MEQEGTEKKALIKDRFDKVKFIPKEELRIKAGVSNKTFCRYLKELGWCGYGIRIPREKEEEILKQVEELAEKYEKSKWANLRKTWEEKTRRSKEKQRQRRLAERKCDWRLVLYGKRGWLVIRSGTKTEMQSWARTFQDNGFMAEARMNMYNEEV